VAHDTNGARTCKGHGGRRGRGIDVKSAHNTFLQVPATLAANGARYSREIPVVKRLGTCDLTARSIHSINCGHGPQGRDDIGQMFDATYFNIHNHLEEIRRAFGET